jgi:hypothetical protein
MPRINEELGLVVGAGSQPGPPTGRAFDSTWPNSF